MARAGSERRIQVASDPASGWLVLWRLTISCWFSRALARALAANPRLPRSLLWCLTVRRWDVRAAAAANPRCPRLLLRWMAWSSDWAVRAAAAASAIASPGLLDRLIDTSPPCVRLYVAANPSLTCTLADELLADVDPYVRGVAATHPAASAAALRRLAAGLSEPAWILRRIAANPSCPADLSDQLLTWIALGAASHADPLFDPLTCTGHPGDTSIPLAAWYLEQAEGDGAERHPLWRVRATVMRAVGRLPGQRGLTLARDPRPEVRQTIAGVHRLPLNIRLELRHDADPVVARLASAPLRRRERA
jgi:hypothetical protein